ncbi:MAG: hypothetical protein KDI90_00900 [Alphaproteobacteria bacterium]|nr:hypothetical protein [Alphaproteobacteria bacterium]
MSILSKGNFSKHEWKAALLGCLEICLFMRQGLGRFDDRPSSAIKSFLIPVILSPLMLAVLVGFSGGFSFNYLLGLHTARVAVTSGLFLAVVYLMTRQYGREAHFMRFVTVNNWMTVPSTLFLLPVVACLVLGVDHSAYETYALFITLAGYVYTAFVLTGCLRLPWEMGGFIAIMGLAIDQHALEFTRSLHQFLM